MMTALPYDDASLENGKHNIIMRSITSLRRGEISVNYLRGDKQMKENKLADLSIDFSVEIIKLVKQ